MMPRRVWEPVERVDGGRRATKMGQPEAVMPGRV